MTAEIRQAALRPAAKGRHMQAECGTTPTESAGRNAEAARTVAATAEQIGVALKESQRPVEQLGASVGRIIRTVASLRNAASDPAPCGQGSGEMQELDGALSLLSTDAAQAIVTLQFYDRMTQHLVHLRDHLAAVSELLAEEQRHVGSGGASARWTDLHEALSQRLLSDQQRQRLLGMTSVESRDSTICGAGNATRSAPSSVEFF